ncbi:MAG: AzlC family ABC transporter permease, partial [Pseudomonadota bacterium]
MDSAPDLSPEPPQTTTIGRRGFRAGLIAALPFYLAAGPFGIIFGVLAREAGLDLGQAMAMSMLVIAGASQLTALQLLSEDAPAFIAILGGAVVNLRMAMYSASLAPWWPGVSQPYRALAATLLHDQSYAASLARYRAREESTADRFGFYLAVGVSTAAIWGVCTWVGATLGAQLPEWLDLTFIVPVVFLAILA